MNELVEKAEKIVTTAELEKRELTDEEVATLGEIRAEVNKITELLGVFKDIEGARGGCEVQDTPVDEQRSVEEMEYRAFDDYLRGTINSRSGELAPSNNGAIIPTTIAKKIIELVYDISPILSKATKFNVKGTLEVPVYPASSSTQISCGYATEFTDLTSSTGNFTKVELKGFVIGALTIVSKSLINNVDFDLVGFVVNRMAYDIARFIEGELINGTSQKIAGLSDCTNVKTLTSTSAISGDDLIALQGMVKDIYQGGAMWVMNGATRDYIRTLKDSDNRYLLQDDISAPFGKTLLGKPVYISDNCGTITSGAKVIYYGDMSGLGVKFAEELNIEVLREKYATSHAIGVLGFAELDAKTLDNQKIAVLKMGTTSVGA